MLREAARLSSGHDYEAWVANCGRNVSHHSGFIPLLRRLDVLRTDKKQDVEKLTFHGPKRYALCTSADGSRKALDKLVSLIQFADVAADVLLSVQGPKTCRAWCSAHARLLEAVEQHPSPGMSVKSTAGVPYLTAWTCRGMLLHKIYETGVAQLRADDIPVQEFAESFPDQKGAVAKLQGHWRARGPGVDTVKSLFQRTLVKLPPEYLTMAMCFTEEQKVMRKVSTQWLEDNCAVLTAERAAMCKREGQNPVLCRLVQRVRDISAP